MTDGSDGTGAPSVILSLPPCAFAASLGAGIHQNLDVPSYARLSRRLCIFNTPESLQRLGKELRLKELGSVESAFFTRLNSGRSRIRISLPPISALENSPSTSTEMFWTLVPRC
eukprot:SAG31_NODE_2790_length_5089_cov_1.785772_2_plen_114_part_00